MNRFVAYAFFPVLIVFSYAPSQGAILGALECDAQDKMARIKNLLQQMSPADKSELVRVLRADAEDLASSASVSAADAEVSGINQGRPAPGSCDGIQLEVPRSLHDAAYKNKPDAIWHLITIENYNQVTRDGRSFMAIALQYGHYDFAAQALLECEDMLDQLQGSRDVLLKRSTKSSDYAGSMCAKMSADYYGLARWMVDARLKIRALKSA